MTVRGCPGHDHHRDLARLGQTVIADKGYRSAEFEAALNHERITLIRPQTKPNSPAPVTSS